MGRLLRFWPEPRICYLQGESKLEGWERAGTRPGQASIWMEES